MNDIERAEINRQLALLKEIETHVKTLSYNCSSIGLDTMSERLKEQVSKCRTVMSALETLAAKKIKNQPVV